MAKSCLGVLDAIAMRGGQSDGKRSGTQLMMYREDARKNERCRSEGAVFGGRWWDVPFTCEKWPP